MPNFRIDLLISNKQQKLKKGEEEEFFLWKKLSKLT